MLHVTRTEKHGKIPFLINERVLQKKKRADLTTACYGLLNTPYNCANTVTFCGLISWRAVKRRKCNENILSQVKVIKTVL